MLNIWYFIIAGAVAAGTFHGLWLSDIVLRREWKRLAQSWKSINDSRCELERRQDEFWHLQDPIQRWNSPEE